MVDSWNAERERNALRRRLRLFDQASRLARFGAWECELSTERLTWTEGVYDLFGLTPGWPLKRAAIVDLYQDESRREMEFMRAEAIRSGQNFEVESQIRTIRGEVRWMRLSAGVVSEQGRPIRLFGSKQDITAEREVRDRLRRLAERDTLTGLANRALFEDRYREVIRSGLDGGSVSALVLIDLDHFKAVNDGQGHGAGDECLRQVALRLQDVFADAMLVARIGGDEFAVLLRAPLGPARIAQMLRRASAALSRPMLWNGARLDISASIGATILGRPHRRKPSELFAEADAALYQAKGAGRNAVRIFGEPTLHLAVARASGLL
ncbi:diguanylate cyclase [Enterovirga sp.]|jgi:diguanylate cyclase (GGDEF)-like protein/PAS domain S-box-containing protein|uniref:diguanylate cyclase domain-containing protein n=1 Tax=Enterovirga sp. TaxID=2026350 RepID=UPI0026172470|nr:diguanylate cyclase [Enterovirga sp.]MDB5592314.1 hypothetical protein [Enterovirga sp.]